MRRLFTLEHLLQAPAGHEILTYGLRNPETYANHPSHFDRGHTDANETVAIFSGGMGVDRQDVRIRAVRTGLGWSISHEVIIDGEDA